MIFQGLPLVWPQNWLGGVWCVQLTCYGGAFILVIPGNREDLLSRPTHKLTEDITDLFLLLSDSDNTGVDQDCIHDIKDNNDGGVVVDHFIDSESGSCA